MIGNARQEKRRSGILVDEELNPPSFSVGEGIAGNLRDGGGDASLVLSVETQQSRGLSGLLTHSHHIVLSVDRDCENG
jgi:hypothetical protein